MEILQLENTIIKMENSMDGLIDWRWQKKELMHTEEQKHIEYEQSFSLTHI